MTAAKKGEPVAFEVRLERLEAIVAELGDDGVPLDRALALFEEGLAQLKAASGELERAEATLKQLVEQADGSFDLTDVRSRTD